MKGSTLVVVVCTALLGFNVTAVADEKVDQAIEELELRFAKVNSYTAKMKAMTDSELSPGHTHKTEMVGAAEWMRKGEKALMRSDTKVKTTETQAGQTKQTTSTITTVIDEEFSYTLTDQEGQKTVIKSQAAPASMHHPKGVFEQYQKYYNVKLLPDEKVNGHDCFVFEARMKPMEGMPPSGRQLMYYQKDNGLQVKSEAFDADEKLISSSVTTDIKLNADIPAERFKFEIPEGAQLMDHTGSQAQQTQTESSAEQTEKPKAEGAKDEKKKKKKGIKLPKRPKFP